MGFDSFTRYLFFILRYGLDNAGFQQQAVTAKVAEQAIAVLLAHKVVINRRSCGLDYILVALDNCVKLDSPVATNKRAQDRSVHVVVCLLHIGQHDPAAALYDRN